MKKESSWCIDQYTVDGLGFFLIQWEKAWIVYSEVSEFFKVSDYMSIVNHRILMILNCQEYLNQNTESSPERDLSGLVVEYGYSSDPES